MKVKPPENRRKFAADWDEIGYLYHKLLYWLYQRENVKKARSFAERLEPILTKADPNHQAILGQECWSLIFESKRDFQKAIKHRKNEIRLIRRLHKISRNTPFENEMMNDYGYGDLSDRMDLLAMLYHAAGRVDKAIGMLEESKLLCDAHKIKFDGNDMLEEYLEEKRESTELGAA